MDGRIKGSREALGGVVTLPITKFQHNDGFSDLIYDYRTNVPLYPQFQAFFRERKPATQIVWGKNDKISPAEGAHPSLRDLPDAELHLLDTGHFVLEDKLDAMAPRIHDFLDRSVTSRRRPHRPRLRPPV